MTLIHFDTTYIVVKAKYEDIKDQLSYQFINTIDQSNVPVTIRTNKIAYIADYQS